MAQRSQIRPICPDKEGNCLMKDRPKEVNKTGCRSQLGPNQLGKMPHPLLLSMRFGKLQPKTFLLN